MQDQSFARPATTRGFNKKNKRDIVRFVGKKDVLGVGDDARLDATLFARLGKSQLPPRSPRFLVLEPGMFRRAGIIQCVDDSLR